MRAPSFAGVAAAAAVVAGAAFVAVGATRLDTQTSKGLLRERGLPTQHEIVEEARRAGICVEPAGDKKLRVTGRGGPDAARMRDPEAFEHVVESLDLLNWYEIRC